MTDADTYVDTGEGVEPVALALAPRMVRMAVSVMVRTVEPFCPSVHGPTTRLPTAHADAPARTPGENSPWSRYQHGHGDLYVCTPDRSESEPRGDTSALESRAGAQADW
jgi:hypothetical protein